MNDDDGDDDDNDDDDDEVDSGNQFGAHQRWR